MVEKKETKSKGKEFIWLGLRISFWIMLGLWILSTIYGYANPTATYTSSIWMVVSIIWLISVIFTFVVSIIHLTKYKEKAMAIVALVVSSLMILLVLLGFLFGVGGAVA